MKQKKFTKVHVAEGSPEELHANIFIWEEKHWGEGIEPVMCGSVTQIRMQNGPDKFTLPVTYIQKFD